MFVYADNAATTRTDSDVVKAMLPIFTEMYGNPSSLHSKGKDAYFKLAEAREKVASAINCDPSEIYFTAGGTEADNWAIAGVAKKLAQNGKHIIVSSIEHHAVMHCVEKNGYDVTYLPVDDKGFVNAESLEKSIRSDTILVSIMLANNEIGSIQPVKELASIAHRHNVLFFTDAVQAVGHIPVDVRAMGVDMLSMSAHKFNAPKGVGALYIRKGLLLPNLMEGGGQEKNRRPGTENTASIVGMGVAIEKAVAGLEKNVEYVTALRERLASKLMAAIPYSRRNSPAENCLPGIFNISVEYAEGEALLLMLDLKGICASSGSACASGSLDPSHVLLALGLSHETAHGSIRFSLDHNNTEEEIDYIAYVFPEIVKKLREMSPLWETRDKKQEGNNDDLQ